MFVRIVLFILLASPWASSDGIAQLQSGAGSVTLVAHVEESFTLQPVQVSAAARHTAQSESVPPLLNVMMGWRLRPGVQFHLDYAISSASDGIPTASERVILSRATQAAPILSFLPSNKRNSRLFAAWGNTEADAVGAASVTLMIPAAVESEPSVLRLTLVAL